MLEGGDRAVGVGEGGLEMGEDLRGRLACGIGGSGAATRAAGSVPQGRADLALSQVEPFPDALPGPLAQPGSRRRGWRRGCCRRWRVGGTATGAGGQAEPPDFVGEPDAEGPPATGPGVAVAAKDPPGAQRSFLGAALVKSVQKAVPNQRADNLAVRAGRLLEPFRNRPPIPRRCGKTSAPRPRACLRRK